MAFALPREPLKPVRTLAVHVRPGCTVLRADELQVLADGRQTIAAAAAQADLVLGQAQAAYEVAIAESSTEGGSKKDLVKAAYELENANKAALDAQARAEDEYYAKLQKQRDNDAKKARKAREEAAKAADAEEEEATSKTNESMLGKLRNYVEVLDEE